MSFRALCGGQVMAACGGVWDRRFLAALGGEFVAVFLFMLISLGSTVSLDDGAVPSTHIALCFGFTVAVLVHSFGHICEACLNPAVVLAMVLTRKITIAKGFLYIVVQCLASFTGTAFVFLATRAEYRKAFGVTKVNTSITVGQALLIESTTTLLLVFALFASCDRNRTDARLPASLIIGLAVAAGHLFAVPLTGASMNPARSLGPSLLFCEWEHHWVYWVGPTMGAVAACFLYDFLLCPDPELKRRLKAPPHLVEKPEEKELFEVGVRVTPEDKDGIQSDSNISVA